MEAELVRVTSDPLGAALTVAAAVSDTTLTIDDAVDIPESGGLLSLAGVTYAYTGVNHDTNVITLASAVTVAADVDDPVALLTPLGDPAAAMTAWVKFEDMDEPYPAHIPSPIQRNFVEGTDQAGATLTLDYVGGGYVVASQPQRDPYMTRRATAASIPNGAGVWTAVTGWTDSVIQGVVVESDGSVTITYPGFYVIPAAPSFATSATGTRGARIKADGLVVAYMAIPADPAGTTDVPITAHRVLEEGTNVTIEVSQTSGVALSLVAGDGISPFSLYRVAV